MSSKSFTFTVHGLANLLAVAEDRCDNFEVSLFDPSQVKNRKLLFVLKTGNFYRILSEDAQKANYLKVAGYNDRADLSAWFKATKHRDVWSVTNEDNELHLGAIYIFDQKWKNGTGIQSPIKGFKTFGAKGFYVDSARVGVMQTQDGSYLLYWYTQQTEGISLYMEAYEKCREAFKTNKTAKVEIIVPFTNIIANSGSFGLNGAKSNEWRIRESTYCNWLELNDKGAKARAETRLHLTKSISPRPKTIVFDKPFAVAILEKGMQYPSFVAYSSTDVWVKDKSR